jgi:hypothetical protein
MKRFSDMIATSLRIGDGDNSVPNPSICGSQRFDRILHKMAGEKVEGGGDAGDGREIF